MDCKTANQLIWPYIRNELNRDQLDDFLKHIEGCRECREELEIYFTIHAVMDDKKEELQTYNMKEQLNEQIQDTKKYLHECRYWEIARDSCFVLAAAGIVLSCILQLGIWF